METFGRWTVVEKLDGKKWACRCECGTERLVNRYNLVDGKTKCCGCDKKGKRALPGSKRIKHGMNGTPTYRSWVEMRRRCRDPQRDKYHAAMGVSVCERWQSFVNFLADMGERPSLRHSIDRFPNPFGNYEPGNCRWATAEQQANNRRKNGNQHS